MHERMWIRNVCMRGVMCVCAWEKVVSIEPIEVNSWY